MKQNVFKLSYVVLAVVAMITLGFGKLHAQQDAYGHCIADV